MATPRPTIQLIKNNDKKIVIIFLCFLKNSIFYPCKFTLSNIIAKTLNKVQIDLQRFYFKILQASSSISILPSKLLSIPSLQEFFESIPSALGINFKYFLSIELNKYKK